MSSTESLVKLPRFDLLLKSRGETLDDYTRSTPSNEKLIELRDEWFEMDDDVPFYVFAGITEEKAREWMMRDGVC